MMLYPPNFEDKIGFTKIKNIIRNKCQGELGRQFVDKVKFTSNFDLILKLVGQTNDVLRIIRSEGSFPLHEYFDIKGLLTKASKIDAHLQEEEFHQLKLTLSNIDHLIRFLKKNQAEYLNISMLSVGIYLNPTIIFEINRVIDERGKIMNNASEELLSIRDEIQKLEFKVRAKSDRILKKLIEDGYSSDESTVTIRNGRLVVPVRSEFKRVVGGFIHDESSTGQTAFIEPSSLVEVNNDIRTLNYREKREVTRILTRLTDLLRPEISNLFNCYDFLGLMDFIRAKALLAIDLDAIQPEIKKTCIIQWHGARHPILFLSHQLQNKPIVPLTIALDHKQRILIISGPNAGGKSICLQTVVLIQYMLQCGILVPVAEGSVSGIFNQIFIDIGDEQSVENDLSTYSSHLINMKHFVNYANNRTLFLIDEFGTGTEPQFGGAIAESILEKLRRQNAYGIITTHYTNLKKYAEKHSGVINGAMRFDLLKMEPLYLLEIGKPGSSFALEISKKIGLPEEIIHQAQKLIGTTHVKFERLLSELEQEKKELEDQKYRIGRKEKKIELLSSEYEHLKTYLEKQQKSLINEAKQKAETLIKNANKEIERTIRIIKEEKAEKHITRKVREKLEKFREEIQPGTEPSIEVNENDQKISFLEGEIKVGDYVQITSTGTVGIILKIVKKSAEVAMGDLKSKIPLEKLVKISRKSYEKISPTKSSLKGVNFIEKGKSFSSTLDIRGKRAEEVIGLLSSYLDEALLLNQREVKILHGKGDGILRKVVRDFIKDLPFIANYTDESVEMGGAGITVITLT